MQEKMAKYMVDIFGDMLLTEPLANFPVSILKNEEFSSFRKSFLLT